MPPSDLLNYFDIHFIEETEQIVIIVKQSTIDEMQTQNIDNQEFTIYYDVEGEKKDELIISLNFPSNVVNENKFQTINSDYDSFMLIRTNPKLTGNIKLVVDSNNDIYLDTIKVPSLSILNQQEYRHQAISDKGDYAHDVYTVFKTLPDGVLFNPGSNTINPYNVYTDINDNYETLYEYGAETNDDMLYHESLKIFAPLYLGKTLPKYFCIFRNVPVPHTSLSFDNDEELRNLIKNSEIIKIFDLRQHTNIGNYLNTYLNELNQYNPEYCNLSFIDQDNKGSITHVGRNGWFGIAVDKGIITNKVETTYFASDIIENKTQDELNIFLLNGFERNNLIYPRIMNLEFMFNDDTADEYKIYNYFGVYLSENDFIHFNQVYTDFNANDIKVYIDGNNEVFDIYDVEHNLDVISDPDFDDRLFFVTSPNDVANINSVNDLQVFINEYVCDKPLKSICNIDGYIVQPEEGVKSFMTLYFSEQLKAGEHIKFICQPESGESSEFMGYDTDELDDTSIPPVIFEIIMSNDPHLKNTQFNISPRVITNNKLDNNSNAQNYYYRMTCYVDNEYGELAALGEQIDRIIRCINKFNTPFLHIENYNDNCIGLTSTLYRVEVQHILSMIPNNDIDDIVDPLKYFNKTFDNDILVLDELQDDSSYYTNFGFDIIRNRYYTKEFFRNLTTGKYYQIHDNLKDKLNNVKFPIVRTVNGYKALQNIDNDELTIISPFDPDMYMIHSPYTIEQLNGYINICEPVNANIALMGIYGVKDFDMSEQPEKYISVDQTQIDIFDADEKIELDKGYIYKLQEGMIKNIEHTADTLIVKLENNKYVYIGKNEKGNNEVCDTNVLQADTRVVLLKMISNNDIVQELTSMKPGITFDNFYTMDKSQLMVPVVPQVNFTWKSTGQYFDKNSYLDINLLKTKNTDGDFNKNFTQIDFNTQNPLRKFIVENNIQTAVCHYDAYINKLSFVYYGILFTWNINNKGNVNIVDFQKLNNYEITFVNNYNSEYKNNIYISHSEKIIIIELHNYDFWNQLHINNVTVVNDVEIKYEDYNIFELPYHYNIETSAINSNVYNLSSENNTDVDVNKLFYGFYQKNKGIDISQDIVNSTWFVEHDSFEDDSFMYDLKIHKSRHLYDVVRMTKPQLKNFVKIIATKLESEFNHSYDKHLYAIKTQYNTTQDNNYELSKGFDINSFVFNYVDENKFGVVYDNDTIKSEVKIPVNIKYQSDNFISSFNNIIEFYDYDAEIDNAFDSKIDSFGLNTKIKHVNYIENYTCNKVLDNIQFTYDKENNEHNYYMFNRSVLQMPTDFGIYRIYTDNNNYEHYSGYANGVRDKMMFASQCILLKSDIIIDTYLPDFISYELTTSLFNENDEAQEELVFTVNATEHFIQHFMNSNTFMSNFAGQQKYDINNYILKTLTNFYNFDNIEIELYGKFNETKLRNKNATYFITSRPKDNEFISYELLTNYKTESIIDNDNINIKITIPYNKSYTYYPILKINRL